MDTILSMSTQELSRLEIMQRLTQKQMSQKKAGEMLNLGIRQVKRLLRSYRQEGATGLISKQRGRKSNHQMVAEVKQGALNLLKTKYADFGPTLAREHLSESDQLHLSVESVRKIMVEEGLWKARKAKKVTTHQLRERRACFGELVQIDGSPHDWFEGRAEACTLLVFIDDATGRLVELQFVQSESFFTYGQSAQSYFTRTGKPAAFYSDKHSIFRVNLPNAGKGDAVTQFGRAMQELDVQIICANTPQAKGRVERVNQTLQDRLVKEMRLLGISSREAGNAYLPTFIQDFNQRFAEAPRSSVDAHRPLTSHENLSHILTWQEPRTLSKNLTLQFDKVVYQIQTERPTYALRHAEVTVCLDSAQHVAIFYKGKSLPYTIFNKQTHQADVVAAKDVNHAVNVVSLPHKPSPNHPWRRGYPTPLPIQSNVSP